MTNQELYWKLIGLLGNLADPCVDNENAEEEEAPSYSSLIDAAIHAAADRRASSADYKIFAKALKACKLKY